MNVVDSHGKREEQRGEGALTSDRRWCHSFFQIAMPTYCKEVINDWAYSNQITGSHHHNMKDYGPAKS